MFALASLSGHVLLPISLHSTPSHLANSFSSFTSPFKCPFFRTTLPWPPLLQISSEPLLYLVSQSYSLCYSFPAMNTICFYSSSFKEHLPLPLNCKLQNSKRLDFRLSTMDFPHLEQYLAHGRLTDLYELAWISPEHCEPLVTIPRVCQKHLSSPAHLHLEFLVDSAHIFAWLNLVSLIG